MGHAQTDTQIAFDQPNLHISFQSLANIGLAWYDRSKSVFATIHEDESHECHFGTIVQLKVLMQSFQDNSSNYMLYTSDSGLSPAFTCTCILFLLYAIKNKPTNQRKIDSLNRLNLLRQIRKQNQRNLEQIFCQQLWILEASVCVWHIRGGPKSENTTMIANLTVWTLLI